MASDKLSKKIEEELLRLSKEEQRGAKARRYYVMLFALMAVYSVLAAGIFAFKDNDSFFTPEDTKSINELQTELEATQRETQQTDENVKKLITILEKPVQDPGQKALLARIEKLEIKQRAIETTVLEDPEKALTARLLREKQSNLEQQVKELKEDNAKLDSKIDQFISTIITVPIIGFALALLSIVIVWVWRKIFRASSAAEEVTSI